MKTIRHYALYNFFWPELWHCSKQNPLKFGKRPKTIQYIFWKHSVEHIVLKGFFIKMGSTFIKVSMFSAFLYLNFTINITLKNAACKCRQILKWDLLKRYVISVRTWQNLKHLKFRLILSYLYLRHWWERIAIFFSGIAHFSC